jgi:hypothetical protein
MVLGGADSVFCGEDEVAEAIELSKDGVTEVIFLVHRGF